MDINARDYRRIKRIPFRYIPIMLPAYLSINVLGLALPLSMKKIYGSVLTSRSREALAWIMLFAFIAMILEGLLRMVRDSTTKWISAQYEHKMTVHYISRILHGQESVTDSGIVDSEKVKSIGRLAAFSSAAWYQLLIDVPFSALFFWLIYLYGGILVVIPMMTGAIHVLVTVISSGLYFRTQRDFIRCNDSLMNLLVETLEKIHVIKSSGIEETQINRYKDRLQDTTELEFLRNRYRGTSRILASNLGQLTMFITLVAGGWFISLNQLTFAEVTACSILGSRAVGPIVSVMTFYMDTKEMSILSSRIEDVAVRDDRYEPDVPMFPADVRGILEIQDLKVTDLHLGREKVLNGLMKVGDYVHVDPWAFNGYRSFFNHVSGKSAVKDGVILVDNLDINKWNLQGLKGKIELMNDKGVIFKGTVMENICFFDNNKTHKAIDAAALTGLDVLIADMPQGYATPLDRHSLNHLSSAFIQRLNMTRCLLDRPRILLLDRVDESMDEETLTSFIWLLSQLKGKTTVIAATKNPRIVEMMDYSIWPVDEGKASKEVAVNEQ